MDKNTGADDSESSGSEKDVEENMVEALQSEVEEIVLKDAVDAKNDGRILKDEQDEIIKVDWATYKKYFRFAGGWGIFVSLNILVILITSISMIANFYT